jgi:hypothetical protein
MQWAVTYWIGISEMGYTPSIPERVFCVTMWWIVVEDYVLVYWNILEYNGHNVF